MSTTETRRLKEQDLRARRAGPRAVRASGAPPNVAVRAAARVTSAATRTTRHRPRAHEQERGEHVEVLDGGDRNFHGALIVVRPGQVRYQGTDGNGTVRIAEENGRRVLRFLRDGGGVDAIFRQF